MSNVRIADLNVGCLHDNFCENLQQICNILKVAKPNILCLQEMPEDTEVLFDKIKDICELPYCFYQRTSESHINVGHNMGLCVFSSEKIEHISTLQLNKPDIEVYYNNQREYLHDKRFVCVKTTVSNIETMVVTGHFFPLHRYNLQAESFLETFSLIDKWFIETAVSTGCQTFLAADFNICNPLDYMPQTAKDYYDIFENEATRPSGRKTDAIIISKTKRDNIVKKINAPLILDHNYIQSEISLS